MKKIILLGLIALAILSCKKESQESFGTTPATETPEITPEVASPEDLGKSLFEGKGNCTTCHQIDQKVIGPSVKDIAKIYKQKNGNIISFLKEESEPIIDPDQYALMKPNLALTKTFTEEELNALEAYIYSNL
ncbi:c-type cytochrome [Flavobacterium agrisoli]|uniref:C-type cytochrome n=1 Tax=Flavobacterium agrisoli TaxID=2793066 RepID=A0A934UJ99_9FLAO|nr:c-type cytochrome [Flavobacterium agrisoli]MBK0369677.1 c-type cytochrome [Flavobacterium agrisoli]